MEQLAELLKAKEKRQQDVVELAEQRVELTEDKAELRARKAAGQAVAELQSRVAKEEMKVDQSKLGLIRDEINVAKQQKQAAEASLTLLQQQQQQQQQGEGGFNQSKVFGATEKISKAESRQSKLQQQVVNTERRLEEELSQQSGSTVKAAEAKVSLFTNELAQMTKRQRDDMKLMKRKNNELKLAQLSNNNNNNNMTVSEVVERDWSHTASRVQEQQAEILQQIAKVRSIVR